MSKRANEFLFFLVISLTVRGLYIFMFHNCASYDLHCWDEVGTILMAGGNPYNLTTHLNWPPFWMQLIFLFTKLSLALHIPFNDVVRAFLILVESALALLLYATIIRFTKTPSTTRWLLLGMALNPISIFLVCQHCNFDVLVGFWVLLAIYMLLRFQEQHESPFWLWACFALGMGILTKTVPLCLSPLLLVSLRKLKLPEKLLGLVLLLGPVFLGLSILYVLDPQSIQTNVLEYRAVQGVFGFTGLCHYFGLTYLQAQWSLIFEIVYGIGWICVWIWLWSREKLEPKKMVLVAVALLLAIPAIGPGYGPQYAYWFIPLLILTYIWGDRSIRIFLLSMYLVATVTYTIEYAFNFNTFGAFFLEIVQTQNLLQFGLWISTVPHQTFLWLPLWLLFLIAPVLFGIKIRQGLD